MFVYKITNLINGKIYIGQTRNTILSRWSEHSRPNGRPTPVKMAIKKYGKNNFKIEQIDSATNPEELDIKEKHWIKILKSQDRSVGYNIEEGGSNPIPLMETLIKRVSTRAASQNCIGVWFDKNRKRWSFEISFVNNSFRQKNFNTKIDAQIARDLKLLEFFPEEEAIKMMNFPENIKSYIDGIIKCPKRIIKISYKKSKFKSVNWDKNNKSWYIAITNGGKRLFKKKAYYSESDAAEVADYFNIKYHGKECAFLNFPEKLPLYLSDDYILPKTILSHLKKCQYRFLHIDNINNKLYVDLRSQNIKIRKYGFENEIEAKAFRDKALMEHGLPIPD